MKVLVLHGPNLNLLGTREPEVYGDASLEDVNALLSQTADRLDVRVDYLQANGEGQLVDAIQRAGDHGFAGVLLNGGAYTHSSIALLDALRASNVPCVEVHVSNPSSRERYRWRSVITRSALGQVSGFGVDSYRLALEGLVASLRRG